MKVGDIVEAWWDDHTFVYSNYGGEGVTRVRTCGYYAGEDETTVRIALSLSDGKPADVQVIDRRMLIRLRRVR